MNLKATENLSDFRGRSLLRQLIKEVERLIKAKSTCDLRTISGNGRYGLIVEKLQGIKQTVEAVQDYLKAFDKEINWAILISHGQVTSNKWREKVKDWQKLKELLGIK